MDKQELLKTCSSTDPLMLILRGGGVTRYHCEQTVQHQRVDSHTWRLMTILLAIRPDASRALLVTALYHDVGEAYVGDVPAPIKRTPGVKEALDGVEREFVRYLGVPDEVDLSPEDFALLKCADYIELCLWMRAQPQNARARQIYENGKNYVLQSAEKLRDREKSEVRRLMMSIELYNVQPV